MASKHLLLLILFLFSLPLEAGTTSAPTYLPFQAQLTNTGTDTPITGAVSLRVQILTPTNTCILYDETLGSAVADAKGLVFLSLGKSGGSFAVPFGNISQIFENNIPVTCLPGSGIGSMTPATGETRAIRFDVNGAGMSAFMDIGSVMYAHFANLAQDTYRINSYNVDLTTAPTINQVLTYNGTKWIAANSAGGATTLTGDVTGSGTGSFATTVVNVGGSTAANVNTATVAANNATNVNTASTIVKRDVSGNFSAGTITANLSGNATTATTATGVSGIVPVANGGTGGASFATGELLVGQGASAFTTQTVASANTLGAVVKRDAAGDFSAGTITASLSGNATTATTATTATNVTGTVAVGNGGTGATSHTAGKLLVGQGTSAITTQAMDSLNTASTVVLRDGTGSFAANVITASSFTASNGIYNTSVPDGATAIGYLLDTNILYNTAGAKLLAVKNNAMEKFSVDKDGKVKITGPTTGFTLPNADGTANQVLRTDGAGVVSWQTVGGGGITSIGGQTGASQNLATGSAGTAPAWTSASNTHTLDIPMAATASVTAGLVSNAELIKKSAAFATGRIPFATGNETLGQSNELFWDNTNLRLGIGTTSPTAKLHLPAVATGGGTAPLKFTSSAGTLMTTAETGAMEYDGTDLWFTPVGTTRLKVTLSSGGGGDFLRLDGFSTMTGQIMTNPGTTAAPSLAFAGDPDTGIYSPGAGQLAFTINTAERMRIDTGGIAISTVNPTAKLHLGPVATGGGTAPLKFVTSGGVKMSTAEPGAMEYDGTDLWFTANTGGQKRILFSAGGTADFLDLAGVNAMSGQFKSSVGSQTAPGITFAGDTDTGIYSPGANQLAFTVFGAERMRIDAGGNLLINGGNINLDGAGTRNVGTSRALSGAGQDFGIIVGGAQPGASNANGGNLILSSGISTGTGISKIELRTSQSIAAPTADNILITAMTIIGDQVGVARLPMNAHLHIEQGNSSVAGLRLSPGPILSTTLVGAFEFESSTGKLYFTDNDTTPKRREVGMAIYVASTVTTYSSGTGPASWGNVKTACNSASSGAHMCTADEMVRSAQMGILPGTGDRLLYGVGLGASATVNDCASWSSISAIDKAALWDPSTGRFTTSACDSFSPVVKLACCK